MHEHPKENLVSDPLNSLYYVARLSVVWDCNSIDLRKATTGLETAKITGFGGQRGRNDTWGTSVFRLATPLKTIEGAFSGKSPAGTGVVIA